MRKNTIIWTQILTHHLSPSFQGLILKPHLSLSHRGFQVTHTSLWEPPESLAPRDTNTSPPSATRSSTLLPSTPSTLSLSLSQHRPSLTCRLKGPVATPNITDQHRPHRNKHHRTSSNPHQTSLSTPPLRSPSTLSLSQKKEKIKINGAVKKYWKTYKNKTSLLR